MHKQLKILTVVFNGPIRSWEIPAFRGAVIEKAGRENHLFHNHLEAGFRYRYPLIQYKRLRGQPTLLCLGAGIDEIHHFFMKRDWSLNISGRKIDMTIDQLNMQPFTLRVAEEMHTYQIRNWVALNQANYVEYQQLTSMVDRITFLEKKLVANILSFAKGADWHIDSTISVRITEMGESRPVRVKGISVQGFNLDFEANIALPRHIGLGGKVALGYGMLHPKRSVRKPLRRPVLASAE